MAGALVMLLLPAGAFGGTTTHALLPAPAAAPRGPEGAPPGAGWTGAGSSGLLPRADVHLRSVASSSFDWPEFHRNSRLTGAESGGTLSAKNASQLGVAWAADLYGAALDSPVVGYDAALGETLAYIGTESGNVLAIDVANGQIAWGTWLGSPIRATPALANGAVFVGTDVNPALFKLNASTGAIDCSAVSPLPIEGSPSIWHLTNGNATAFVGTTDTSTLAGPLLAVNVANCAIVWEFTGYRHPAGSWDPVATAVNVTGVPLVLFGTSDTDSGVYALDARTGAEVWRFQSYNPSPGVYDIGAGVTVSSPGSLGIADGVAYVPSKYGILYALDLSNGTPIWSVNFNQLAGVTGGGRSTAALDGRNLVFGFKGGLFDLNATTGAVVWQYNDTTRTEAISSPAIVGSAGHEIAAVGDLGGGFDVVSLANGTQLYHYQTGGYVTASPAATAGNLLISSSDGFLYDFAVGGGNDATLPTTTISSPRDGATLANPNGNETVTGTANDPNGLAGVVVAVQSSGTGGPWWDQATGAWTPGPMAGAATVNVSANRTSASWSYTFPASAAGGTYEVTVYATSRSGQSDLVGASSGFSVNFTTTGPRLRTTSMYLAPGASATVLGGGFGRTENVTVSLLGSTLATGRTTATGYLPAFSVHVPSRASLGRTSLVATGVISGRVATAAIVISNSWAQSGYGAGHLGFEPNDVTLKNHVYPGGPDWMYLAWHFDAGFAVRASPAVVDGVAYVADTAGDVFAVDIHNGGMLWHWTDPSGASINGSPAVDSAQSLVFVAANDGIVYAISTRNGTLVWNASVGGTLTDPMFGGGEVYVASGNRTIAALRESNGTRSWVTVVTSPVRATVALDVSHHLLLVGEMNGDLVAMNSTTGAHNWTYAAGSPIEASPMVSASKVYVVSAGGNVTCLQESTGGKLWTYRTGGGVVSDAALSNRGTPGGSSLELLVGSLNGNLYAINATNGSLNFLVTVGSPIVGVSALDGVVLFETAAGSVGAARTYSNVTLWDYRTTAGLASAPTVVDGTVFVGAEDGYLYAFTTFGQSPN
ncbi:MAG: PQQ-binding-like beta-propeller repeat protein [Thermoplasmata archaeon]|nr:PQQ-binding-like beta-propeller repeat protein [Thermoplasmata archaeon]